MLIQTDILREAIEALELARTGAVPSAETIARLRGLADDADLGAAPLPACALDTIFDLSIREKRDLIRKIEEGIQEERRDAREARDYCRAENGHPD